MKNKAGLIRSSEHFKSHPEEAPAVHHLRVHHVDNHPDGHVKVTHHASADAKPHATHTFAPGEHAELAQHIMDHVGMPMDSEGGGEEYADQGDERGAAEQG